MEFSERPVDTAGGESGVDAAKPGLGSIPHSIPEGGLRLQNHSSPRPTRVWEMAAEESRWRPGWLRGRLDMLRMQQQRLQQLPMDRWVQT